MSLGIFPLDAAVAFPYFCITPTVEPLDLGRPVSAVLEAPSTNSDGAWYSVDVDAQDYRVSAEFTRVDGVKSNLAAGIDMFGRLGETGPGGENICGVNAIDVSARCARKLVFSEKASLLFRVEHVLMRRSKPSSGSSPSQATSRLAMQRSKEQHSLPRELGAGVQIRHS